jgi:chitinase
VGYQRSLYPEQSVDFSVMTHIFVGRIRPATDGSVITDFDIDAVNGPAMARTLSTRAHGAGRKAVLMLGGDGEHAGFVGAASDANRARFVANLLRTMDDLGYDGIDVDWEPINAADRAPLLALLRELRAARPGMLLTIPVGWVNANFPSEVDGWYAQVAGVVDQMNLMTYFMAGPYSGWVSWHSSALQDHAGNRPSSVASSAQIYLAAGVPAAKLGVGIGAFGSCWRGLTGPRQTVGSGVTMLAGDNAMSYANIMSQYYLSTARVWDDAAKVPYLSFTTPRGPQQCNFVSYEDEQSVTAKGAYVRGAGLGGAILWTVGQQHLPNQPVGSQDPLLKAAYSSIVP